MAGTKLDGGRAVRLKNGKEYGFSHFEEARLRYEDLLDIEAILLEHFQRITITVGDMEMDCVSELPYVGKPFLKELSIVASNQNGDQVAMTVSSGHTGLYPRTKDDPQLLGVCKRVENIIEGRRPRVSIMAMACWLSCCFFVLGLFALDRFAWNSPLPVLAEIGLLLVVTMIPIIVVSAASRYAGVGGAYTSKREYGFLARNRDRLILAAISAILTALGGVVIKELTK